ncbi:PAS domain-containing protein [Streptomyces sp. SKN60]|uniref:PAS domain-containing protein n=1 Tax=Streptomyces sp. SKN60 TaxID=2855506 RepID=UPI0022480FD2|nr:PAS domain-containing protein [Streptomyces sp. SKN60]MCX2179066.1 PAS domain-containing protein [Streptomyces sp. SKN60]
MSSRPSRGAARLAAILDALPDGLVLVNCNGTVVNANTIALGMFETPGTALVGRGLLDLLPDFDSRLIPGSMRRPEGADDRGRTRPTRMMARRTDGGEFPVEVTSASLEDGREAYDSYSGYTGDELLMLVVRDLTGTLDTEAELARSQRQTEMILRAASEGVVGTDTDGRVVLVNPAFAQILGYRAGELGGAELHPLILPKRADGQPFPYEESPLADTLKSGRKHRVRGQVLWAKNGDRVPVDLTTAPVRDGDQLVGAVMTFSDRRPHEQLVESHATELADLTERLTTELEQQKERYEAEAAEQRQRYEEELAEQKRRVAALTARHEQLTAVLGESLRGPLEELRAELGSLAADDAGQLWPEANQLLHHLSAGYGRMTTLVDNVLGYQRLDAGAEHLDKDVVLLSGIVTGGIDGAVDLIGPGRAQFAVHAPPIEAEVDATRLTTALAHLVADVAGVGATGKSKAAPPQGGGYADSTIVVAAAPRGDVVRIEVRGPYAGGDPVHQPIVRGIVAAHGGVLQTHEVPGTTGGAYVVELPLGAGRGTVPEAPVLSERPEEPRPEELRSAELRPESPKANEAEPVLTPAVGQPVPVPAPHVAEQHVAEQHVAGELPALPAQPAPTGAPADAPTDTQGGGGRRRARRASTDAFLESPMAPEGAPVPQPTGRRRGRAGDTPATGTPAELIPAQSTPAPAPPAAAAASGTGRRRGRPAEGAVMTAAESAQGRPALGAAVPPQGVPVDAPAPAPAQAPAALALPAVASAPQEAPGAEQAAPQPTGRRRRALAAAQERAAAAEAGPRTPFALPPADADRAEPHAGDAQDSTHEAVRTLPEDDHTPPQPHPLPTAPTAPPAPSATGTGSVPLPPEVPMAPAAPAAPAGPTTRDGGTQGRAFSVRTLGQGVPFVQSAKPASAVPTPAKPTSAAPTPAAPLPAPATPPVPAGATPATPSGRRRKLGNPAAEGRQPAPEAATAHPPVEPPVPSPVPMPVPVPVPVSVPVPAPAQASEGRAYAIEAPAEGSAEGPEPLDGPGGAVEVSNQPLPQPVDDELPPEPLDNPRRLLVWPAPDVSTQQALSDRGYRPVIVHSREEVDAQIAAFPAALFVDPLTGPITRTALQSLRQAAVAAEVPVLLAAGLGQATREAAYGADPAVLLKALAPRDSEQHPSRVLVIEEHEDIAQALAATLERRGMQVARAATDTEAVALAQQIRPNLVVMDLMQVRRRRAGIIDWLRANGQLNRTPLVVYTSTDLDEAELATLSSGETVLFLAERSTSDEVQARIVDLLAKIGTN